MYPLILGRSAPEGTRRLSSDRDGAATLTRDSAAHALLVAHSLALGQNDHMDNVRLAIKLLQAVGVAQAADEQLDLDDLAAELGVSRPEVEHEINQAVRAGLMLDADESSTKPMLLDSGRQYIARDGHVPDDVLGFLPRTIDDLNTRQALLEGGTMLVDEFRAALLNGTGLEHAAELVPRAFAGAVDERLALNLYAAAVALMARLSAGDRAACVAEEIVAVRLLEEARMLLELGVDRGELAEDEAAAATDELRGLLGLFEDDDVLAMFEMEEPADAAVAAHDSINRQLGAADQRVEAWFRPFGGTPSTGYLADRPDDVDD